MIYLIFAHIPFTHWPRADFSFLRAEFISSDVTPSSPGTKISLSSVLFEEQTIVTVSLFDDIAYKFFVGSGSAAAPDFNMC